MYYGVVTPGLLKTIISIDFKYIGTANVFWPMVLYNFK
jgi:hypothetical protein